MTMLQASAFCSLLLKYSIHPFNEEISRESRWAEQLLLRVINALFASCH